MFALPIEPPERRPGANHRIGFTRLLVSGIVNRWKERDNNCDAPGSTRSVDNSVPEESSAATKIYDRSDRRNEILAATDAAVSAMLLTGKTSKRKLLVQATKPVEGAA
jgi:hypothetical protein